MHFFPTLSLRQYIDRDDFEIRVCSISFCSYSFLNQLSRGYKKFYSRHIQIEQAIVRFVFVRGIQKNVIDNSAFGRLEYQVVHYIEIVYKFQVTIGDTDFRHHSKVPSIITSCSSNSNSRNYWD